MKLYCCTHRQYNNITDDGITVPVLVGMNDADYKLKVRDYLPEISKENLLYNEVELEMYINKFVKDEDIIGLIQYSYRPAMTYDEIKDVLKSKKIIVHKDNINNLYTQYVSCHYAKPIDTMIEVLKGKGIDSDKLDSIMKTNVLYSRHILITDGNTYHKFLDWYLPIMEEIATRLNVHTVEEARNDVINRFGPNYHKIDYQTRIYGFLGERLTTIWINLNINPDDIYVAKFNEFPKMPLG